MPDRDEPRPAMRTNEKLIGRGVGGVAKPLPSQPHDPGEPPLTMQFPGTAPTLRLQLSECHKRLAKLEAAVLDIDAHATPFSEDEDGWITRYLMGVGALHRALGLIGHSAPKCADLPCGRAKVAEFRIDQLLRDLNAIEQIATRQLDGTRDTEWLRRIVDTARAAQRGDTP